MDQRHNSAQDKSPRQSRVQESGIRAGALLGWEELVSKLGGNPDDLARSSGLDLTDPDALIPYAHFEQFLAKIASALVRPDFGLLLGSTQGLEMLGPVGLLMARAPTLRAALVAGQQYMGLHAADEQWRLYLEGNRLCVRRYQYKTYVGDDRQTRELSLAAAISTIRALGGPGATPYSMAFAHEAISSHAVYQKQLRVKPDFNAALDELIYPASVLDLPVRQISAETVERLDAALAQNLSRQGDDPIDRLRWLLTKTQADPSLGVENAAGLLHISTRTLQRRLSESDLQFRGLLSQSRCAAAARLLRASGAGITDIAYAVGYRDTAAFSRAFRRHYAQSPRDYRNTHR